MTDTTLTFFWLNSLSIFFAASVGRSHRTVNEFPQVILVFLAEGRFIFRFVTVFLRLIRFYHKFLSFAGDSNIQILKHQVKSNPISGLKQQKLSKRLSIAIKFLADMWLFCEGHESAINSLVMQYAVSALLLHWVSRDNVATRPSINFQILSTNQNLIQWKSFEHDMGIPLGGWI